MITNKRVRDMEYINSSDLTILIGLIFAKKSVCIGSPVKQISTSFIEQIMIIRYLKREYKFFDLSFFYKYRDSNDNPVEKKLDLNIKLDEINFKKLKIHNKYRVLLIKEILGKPALGENKFSVNEYDTLLKNLDGADTLKINIEIQKDRKEEVSSFFENYIDKLSKDALKDNRENSISIKHQLKHFIDSIDRTNNLNDYKIIGNEHVNAIAYYANFKFLEIIAIEFSEKEFTEGDLKWKVIDEYTPIDNYLDVSYRLKIKKKIFDKKSIRNINKKNEDNIKFSPLEKTILNYILTRYKNNYTNIHIESILTAYKEKKISYSNDEKIQMQKNISAFNHKFEKKYGYKILLRYKVDEYPINPEIENSLK